MTILKTLLASAMMVALGGMASAATIDFSVGTEEAVQDGTTKTYDGIDITFSSGVDGVADTYAYFDTSPADGGLGVCQNFTNSCGGDDNLGIGESVTLMFDQVYEISGLIFTDLNHDPVIGGNLLVIDDGSGASTYTFADAMAATFTTDMLTFSYFSGRVFCIIAPCPVGQAYYVNGMTVNPIPLPAAGWLLIAGLGGLAAMRRRKS